MLHNLLYVPAFRFNQHDHIANSNVPDITVVNETKIWAIYKVESTNVFLFKWDSRIDKDGKWEARTMLVKMISRGFWDKSKVDSIRLLEKYSDFADVFDKNKADRLPEHS